MFDVVIFALNIDSISKSTVLPESFKNLRVISLEFDNLLFLLLSILY